uniref:phospholipid scramblase 2-like n=1 Tax=Callospermophilus lateralis TaxID=76772 RepID=UPI004038E1D2
MAFHNLQSMINWMKTSDRAHWIDTSESTTDCPPGLEYLAEINQLTVCHRFDLEVLCYLEANKTYEVMNNQGHRIYVVEEQSNWFLRYLCGLARPFTMTIYDNTGQVVITVHKGLGGSCCCCIRCHSCCPQKLIVEAPPGKTIGYVHQKFHPIWPNLKIKNQKKEDVMKIKGPCLVSGCLRNLNFNILSVGDERVIGNISKLCPGFMKGLLSDADSFKIQFPYDLDVKIKALMLGAIISLQITPEIQYSHSKEAKTSAL